MRRESTAVAALLQFLEKKLGIRAIYDLALVPQHDPTLIPLIALAKKMHRAQIIYSFQKTPLSPDEPQLFEWNARCVSEVNASEALTASGSSCESDKQALERMLGEVIERYLWAAKTDYLATRTGSVKSLTRSNSIIAPERFAGFSIEARKKTEKLRIAPDQEFTWAKAYSWVSRSSVWVPAHLVTGSQNVGKTPSEPLVQQRTTTGCAAYPTQPGALLRGALEVIERDAYMIMWLNQLTLPRINIEELTHARRSLGTLVERCVRYRLEVHAIRLVTDAPIQAICVVLEDKSHNPLPRLSFGLSAHFSLIDAVEKALVEALRMRRTAQTMYASSPTPAKHRETRAVGHTDRLVYWMHNKKDRALDFMISGPIESLRTGDLAAETGTDADKFERIVEWCRSVGYECLSVAFTKSKANVTPWHIERVLIPELQPLHLNDAWPHTGGARIQAVPKAFGYAPRKEPYTDTPHPFA